MLFVDPLIFTAVLVAGGDYDIDRYLIFALIEQESSFRPHAIGDDGKAFGLMQLHVDGAGYGYEREALLDISFNISTGVRYLADCMRAFPDDLLSAIAAYRQGIQGVRDNGRDVSLAYTHEIMTRAERYRGTAVRPYPTDYRHAYTGAAP